MATVTKPLALDETLEGVRQALLALPGGGNVTTVALNLSDAYDPTAAYAVGDLCIKDNVLYKCSTAIASGGEAWNAAHWTQTTVDEGKAAASSVPNAGSVSSAGVISIKHDLTELFTVQLPLYTGGVSNGT